jgi:ribonuclease HI
MRRTQAPITQFFSKEPLEHDPLAEKENKLIVFTDGSAFDNGKSYCRASYGVVWPYYEDFNIAEEILDGPRTNNRGEFKAFILAMNQSFIIEPTGQKTLILYTDSQLLQNTVSNWMYTWKKNGWKKADGKEIMNRDLVETIYDLCKRRSVVVRHVRAHTNKNDWESTYNAKVDSLVRECLIENNKKNVIK